MFVLLTRGRSIKIIILLNLCVKGGPFMAFNEALFGTLGSMNDISDEPLTYQQMYIELNSILAIANRPKVDRDSFLVYLAANGYIRLNKSSEQKLSVGYVAIRNDLDITEAYVKSAYGIYYFTLLFSKRARIYIYNHIDSYYKFIACHPLSNLKLNKSEYASLLEMLNRNERVEVICLNLSRKPFTIYQVLLRRKILPKA